MPIVNMSKETPPCGLMIAAPRSGSGKTTVTLGLLRALVRRGMRVAPFKCGPDYIDPAFHAAASNRACYNLDSWAMPPDLLDGIFRHGIWGAQLAIVEGSMGLFDGVASPGASGNGASADIAVRFGLPVVLVIDAAGQSQSAGAVVAGFKTFRPELRIAGVILNNVASERHRLLCERGIAQTGLPLLGALPRGGVPHLPERHLGLVQAEELPNTLHIMDAIADAMETHLDINALLAASAPLALPADGTLPAPPAARIALASDIAFSFAYPHLLTGWRAGGAKILPFSPLADEAPDTSADYCFLPGGYPELHAARLSQNRNFIEGLRSFAETKPVHGECGGYMALGETIADASGVSWPMAGLLPLATSFATRKLHMGYRRLGKQRGHEFHYATITHQGRAAPLGEAFNADGKSLGVAGQRAGNVTGSFFHCIAEAA